MAGVDPFRPCRIQHALCHIQESAGSRQRLAVVPGHPVRGRLLQLPTLQLGEVVERIDVVEFAGVNQAHEQVSHLRSIPVLVKQRVLAMQDRFLQCPLHQIIVQRCSRFPQKQREFLPSRYEIALPRPKFGSTFLSANCAPHQIFSFSMTGPLCS